MRLSGQGRREKLLHEDVCWEWAGGTLQGAGLPRSAVVVLAITDKGPPFAVEHSRRAAHVTRHAGQGGWRQRPCPCEYGEHVEQPTIGYAVHARVRETC